MKKQDLIQELKRTDGSEVILRGNFGDTYVNIAAVQPLKEGKILLQTDKNPIPSEEIRTYSNLEELVIEIREFVGTQPELYKNTGVGLEKVGKDEYIYVETEGTDGTFGMISLDEQEARWLSEKLIEYADRLKMKTKKK